MPATFDEMIVFPRQVAADDVPHSGGTYLGRVVSVYRDLKKWGYDEPLERRQQVLALIGE